MAALGMTSAHALAASAGRSALLLPDAPMDGPRFDTLTRSLTTTGSRRRALGGLLLGSLGRLGSRADEATAKKKPCPPCKKRKKGKCKKKPDRTACNGGTCQGGNCVATQSPPPPPRHRLRRRVPVGGRCTARVVTVIPARAFHPSEPRTRPGASAWRRVSRVHVGTTLNVLIPLVRNSASISRLVDQHPAKPAVSFVDTVQPVSSSSARLYVGPSRLATSTTEKSASSTSIVQEN